MFFIPLPFLSIVDEVGFSQRSQVLGGWVSLEFGDGGLSIIVCSVGYLKIGLNLVRESVDHIFCFQIDPIQKISLGHPGEVGHLVIRSLCIVELARTVWNL